MGLITSLITFVVGVLVGGLGIYVGGQLVAGEGSYEKALTVALVGAIVWALAEAFLWWVPLLGPILVFLIYLLVINVSYSGDWVDAAGIAIVAWITVVAVRVVLGPIGFGIVPGVGVPGV